MKHSELRHQPRHVNPRIQVIMATTRIMPLHVGKGRTESRAISDIIDYVANPQKTDEYSGQQVYTVRLLGNRLAIM